MTGVVAVLAGLARMFFVGYLLVVVVLTAVWMAVTSLIAALTSWPGLLLVLAGAVLVALMATGGLPRWRSRWRARTGARTGGARASSMVGARAGAASPVLTWPRVLLFVVGVLVVAFFVAFPL